MTATELEIILVPLLEARSPLEREVLTATYGLELAPSPFGQSVFELTSEAERARMLVLCVIGLRAALDDDLRGAIAAARLREPSNALSHFAEILLIGL